MANEFNYLTRINRNRRLHWEFFIYSKYPRTISRRITHKNKSQELRKTIVLIIIWDLYIKSSSYKHKWAESIKSVKNSFHVNVYQLEGIKGNQIGLKLHLYYNLLILIDKEQKTKSSIQKKEGLKYHFWLDYLRRTRQLMPFKLGVPNCRPNLFVVVSML